MDVTKLEAPEGPSALFNVDVEVFYRRAKKRPYKEPNQQWVEWEGDGLQLGFYPAANIRLDLPGGLLIWGQLAGEPGPQMIPWARIEQLYFVPHQE